MAAPVAILAKPENHRGILTMGEAVNAMIEAFRNWAKDPLVAELRRRTHTPKNVRITLHQGAAPAYGTTGIMAHAELVRIFGDKQKYPRRGRPVLVLYDSDTAALKLILIGEMHPKELPDANSVVAMPTACASMVGTDLLARKDCRVAGVFGAGDQARPAPAPEKLTGQSSRLRLYKAHENQTDDSGAVGEPRGGKKDKGLAEEKQARGTLCVG